MDTKAACTSSGSMRRANAGILLLAVPIAASLGGCAGYAIDYAKPKTSIISPELARYGLDAGQARCVGERLGTTLSVWQLRQLQIRAAPITSGYAQPGRLMPADLVWVSKHGKDPKVGVETAAAAAACGLAQQPARVAAAPPPPPPPPPPAPEPPAPAQAQASSTAAASAKPAWVNLGAAPSGQSIAVDASSLREEGAFRSGWFRLTSPGTAAPTGNSYLLRLDCAAKTINSMALRKHGPNGAVVDNQSYGPGGEGAVPIGPGTVTEIAYLALCT